MEVRARSWFAEEIDQITCIHHEVSRGAWRLAAIDARSRYPRCFHSLNGHANAVYNSPNTSPLLSLAIARKSRQQKNQSRSGHFPKVVTILQYRAGARTANEPIRNPITKRPFPGPSILVPTRKVGVAILRYARPCGARTRVPDPPSSFAVGLNCKPRLKTVREGEGPL